MTLKTGVMAAEKLHFNYILKYIKIKQKAFILYCNIILKFM